MTDDDKAVIGSWLAHLAKHMRFVVTDGIVGGACTEQLGDNDIVLPECPDGFKSLVRIRRSMYDELAAATNDAEDLPCLMMLRFEFAVMLVHELTHALHNLRRGRLEHEPYIGDNAVSKLGFEMERILFGGHLTRIFPEGDPQCQGQRGATSPRRQEEQARRPAGAVGVPVPGSRGRVPSHRHADDGASRSGGDSSAGCRVARVDDIPAALLFGRLLGGAGPRGRRGDAATRADGWGLLPCRRGSQQSASASFEDGEELYTRMAFIASSMEILCRRRGKLRGPAGAASRKCQTMIEGWGPS